MSRAGYIAVITGAFTGDEVAGAVIRFKNFKSDRLSRRYGPADGKLEKEPGLITKHGSGVWARDLVVEAEFVNPKDGNWSYAGLLDPRLRCRPGPPQPVICGPEPGPAVLVTTKASR